MGVFPGAPLLGRVRLYPQIPVEEQFGVGVDQPTIAQVFRYGGSEALPLAGKMRPTSSVIHASRQLDT